MKPTQSFILSATDFSPRSNEAATVAAKLAQRRSEKLRLVHASETMGRVASDLRRRLEAEAERLRQTGADVEAVLLQAARRSEALLSYIRAELPSLVVVASAVKGALDRWVLGSFAERIAEASPVPTLVVRNAEAFEAWDWTKDRLRVLLALDLYSTSDVVLRWAKQFQMAGPCDLISCHVNQRMPTPEEVNAGLGQPENPPLLQKNLERELRKKIRDQIGDDASEIIVKAYFGDPGACIVETALKAKAQLIAVGTHQRHGLARLSQFSVSRELLHQSATNVVCVPVTAKLDQREVHIPDFRRVLVATDFSELGNAAVPFACAACCIGGLVKIIHVASPRVSARLRRAKEGTAELREQLKALIPLETGARCQPPEVEILENRNVAEAICGEADRFGADLVCLSSHGLGISRALHGSVAKAVIKKIRRPLLVIRRPEE